MALLDQLYGSHPVLNQSWARKAVADKMPGYTFDPITVAQAAANREAFANLDPISVNQAVIDRERLVNDPFSGDALAMMRAEPMSVLERYMRTPEQILTHGFGSQALNPYLGMVDRFYADPAYQFTLDEGMRNIQRNAAAKGLLESGATLRDLIQFGIGNANVAFENFRGRELEQWRNYQNALMGVAQGGMQFSSPQAALQTGGQLSGLTGTLGQGLANLYGSQGQFGGGAYLSTGANQANAAMQAASIQGQLEAARMQAQAQVQSSKLGAGASLASSLIGALI